MKDAQTFPRPSIPSEEKAPGVSGDGQPAGVRHISRQKHQETKRKVLAVHDGLLRRLAEHDRQR